MDLGKPRKLSKKEDALECFVERMYRELDIIRVYLYDMQDFFVTKQALIEDEIKEEDPYIKYSLLQQPNYQLYDKIFNDLVYKNIFVSLVSKLEISLIKLIEELGNQQLISEKFVKPRKAIIRNTNKYLEKKLNIQNNIEKIEFYILIRNSIIHNNSFVNNKIKEDSNYKDFVNYVVFKGDVFYFESLEYPLCLLREIGSYFQEIRNKVS